ncbi:TPA: histidinol phosphate phosphatase domain-containing protein [Candidatus Bathyarchaeota archaeon]|nr:histidinol phosphate phosphatase domain-containing protein [Candidatus Bathyarchaeota archaeon]
MRLGRRADFHTHSLLSDGAIISSEIAARAQSLGYEAVAVTDHADASNIDHVVSRIVSTFDGIQDDFSVALIPGIELTHVPPKKIEPLVREARRLGALLIIVHGETIVEPVIKGTNETAVSCSLVDVLAHPGLLTEREAELARENDVYIELTTRKGHCLTNGLVAKVGLEGGVDFLVNTDMHEPSELITQEEALKAALGSALPYERALEAVRDSPRRLLKRLGIR